jgi:hypothetical protein
MCDRWHTSYPDPTDRLLVRPSGWSCSTLISDRLGCTSASKCSPLKPFTRLGRADGRVPLLRRLNRDVVIPRKAGEHPARSPSTPRTKLEPQPQKRSHSSAFPTAADFRAKQPDHGRIFLSHPCTKSSGTDRAPSFPRGGRNQKCPGTWDIRSRAGQ